MPTPSPNSAPAPPPGAVEGIVRRSFACAGEPIFRRSAFPKPDPVRPKPENHLARSGCRIQPLPRWNRERRTIPWSLMIRSRSTGSNQTEPGIVAIRSDVLMLRPRPGLPPVESGRQRPGTSDPSIHPPAPRSRHRGAPAASGYPHIPIPIPMPGRESNGNTDSPARCIGERTSATDRHHADKLDQTAWTTTPGAAIRRQSAMSIILPPPIPNFELKAISFNHPSSGT